MNPLGRAIAVTAAAAMLASAAGCGPYSTKGRTAGDIKKIAVPNFSNETSQPDIEIDITNNLRSGIIADNTLKVVPDDEADAVLEGTIAKYDAVPFTFDPNLQAEQYRLLITIRVSLFNPKDNTYIWKDKEIGAHSDYFLDPTTDRTYDRALEEVYKDLVEGILNATTQEW